MITSLWAVKYEIDGKQEWALAYVNSENEWIDYVSELELLNEGNERGRILQAMPLESAWPCPMAG